MRVQRPVYQEVEHTADVGVIVRADDLGALFERAAAAMFDLIVDLDQIDCRPTPLDVRVAAGDREQLLVVWLAELLSLAAAEELLLGSFEVEHVDATNLCGRAWGEPIDDARHRFKAEIKAVTYHHLAVTNDRSGWRAEVIFDV